MAFTPDREAPLDQAYGPSLGGAKTDGLDGAVTGCDLNPVSRRAKSLPFATPLRSNQPLRPSGQKGASHVKPVLSTRSIRARDRERDGTWQRRARSDIF